jgi:hypothetical protein
MANYTVRQLYAELTQDLTPQRSSSKRKLEMKGDLRIWKQSLGGLRRDSLQRHSSSQDGQDESYRREGCRELRELSASQLGCLRPVKKMVDR